MESPRGQLQVFPVCFLGVQGLDGVAGKTQDLGTSSAFSKEESLLTVL